VSANRAAHLSPHFSDCSPIGSERAGLVAAWPTLAEPIRRTILALIEAAGG
jgi:hypothetical protein